MSHGYYTISGKRVAAASVFFDTLPYKVNPATGLIDYDKMEEKAMEYRPKVLICGGSSYPGSGTSPGVGRSPLPLRGCPHVRHGAHQWPCGCQGTFPSFILSSPCFSASTHF